MKQATFIALIATAVATLVQLYFLANALGLVNNYHYENKTEYIFSQTFYVLYHGALFYFFLILHQKQSK